MPDVPRAVLAGSFERHTDAECATQLRGDFAKRDRLTRSRVQGLAIRGRAIHREQSGLHDVANADKIPHLQTIFEDDWRIAVHQPRGKNCRNSGVRIRQRLPAAVNVEVSQCYRWNTVSPAE